MRARRVPGSRFFLPSACRPWPGGQRHTRRRLCRTHTHHTPTHPPRSLPTAARQGQPGPPGSHWRCPALAADSGRGGGDGPSTSGAPSNPRTPPTGPAAPTQPANEPRAFFSRSVFPQASTERAAGALATVSRRSRAGTSSSRGGSTRETGSCSRGRGRGRQRRRSTRSSSSTGRRGGRSVECPQARAVRLCAACAQTGHTSLRLSGVSSALLPLIRRRAQFRRTRRLHGGRGNGVFGIGAVLVRPADMTLMPVPFWSPRRLIGIGKSLAVVSLRRVGVS